jgi:hypothetical protein
MHLRCRRQSPGKSARTAHSRPAAFWRATASMSVARPRRRTARERGNLRPLRSADRRPQLTRQSRLLAYPPISAAVQVGSVTVSAMPGWVFCACRRLWSAGSVPVAHAVRGYQLCRSGLADSGHCPGQDQTGTAAGPGGCQRCLRSASALSPAAKMMAALGAEPQLRVRRKPSGRTRRRSSISCRGSHGRSSTRAQKRAW